MNKTFCFIIGCVLILPLINIHNAWAAGEIEMTMDPEIPDAGKMTMLTFTARTEDGKVWEHIDYEIIFYKGDEQILDHEFHTHTGIFTIEVIPESTSEFDIESPEGEDGAEDHGSHDEHEEKEEGNPFYKVAGPLFLDQGNYKVVAKVVGIEFKPLPPESVLSQEFSLEVIPEFPLAALVPFVFAFAVMIALVRFKSTID
jgi:hypothetical protein